VAVLTGAPLSAAVRAPPKVTLSPESKRRVEREREREEMDYLASVSYIRVRTHTHTHTALIHKAQTENSAKQGWGIQKMIKMKIMRGEKHLL